MKNLVIVAVGEDQLFCASRKEQVKLDKNKFKFCVYNQLGTKTFIQRNELILSLQSKCIHYFIRHEQPRWQKICAQHLTQSRHSRLSTHEIAARRKSGYSCDTANVIHCAKA